MAAAALARRVSDDWCLADALQILAYTHLLEFEHRDAERVLKEAFPICDRNDNQFQRAWHHTGMAWVAMLRAEFNAAEQEMDRAMTLARAVGDPALELRACSILGLVLQEQGRPSDLAAELAVIRTERREWGTFGDTLLAALEAMATITDNPAEASERLEVIGTTFFEGGALLDATYVLAVAALAALEAGKPEDCDRLAVQTEACAPSEFRSRARLLRGIAARMLGYPQASDLLHDSLAELSAHEVLVGVPLTLENLGGAAADDGEPLEAARFLGAAETLRLTTGQKRLAAEQVRFDADLAAIRNSLGDDFEAAWNEGTRLSAEDAVSYARRARGERKRPSSGWDSLTPTESQVVDLAAQGLTNPEIGQRLFMGRGTVKTHLSHVFAKLNVTTRAELAAMATRYNAMRPDRSTRYQNDDAPG